MSFNIKAECIVRIAALLYVVTSFAAYAGNPPRKDASTTPVVQSSTADTMRIEGEQRFHANCGRCHASPQKFPPRVMATVVRHMRVRAMLTDEDMKMILFFMTQ